MSFRGSDIKTLVKHVGFSGQDKGWMMRDAPMKGQYCGVNKQSMEETLSGIPGEGECNFEQ